MKLIRGTKLHRKILEVGQAVLMGMGKNGKNLAIELGESSNLEGKIIAIFDNSNDLLGKIHFGHVIEKPRYIPNCLYVITPRDEEVRRVLYKQIIDLGVSSEFIVVYATHGDYDYYFSLSEADYKDEISDLYYEAFGKEMNWENPMTFNEILNWEKLYNHDPLRTTLADKYAVRDWVAAKIGENYLTKLYGVWDNPDDIDFTMLPNAFVLKPNNGSGRNIVCKDKRLLDVNMTKNRLKEYLQPSRSHFYSGTFEWQYKNIMPKVICEEYLQGVAESVYDYQFYCFGGEPKYIWCIKASHLPHCQASFYDLNWQMQPFSFGYPKDEMIAPKPSKLEEMIKIAKILSKGFSHIRVDLYNLPDGRVLFGELTMTSWAGLKSFIPEKYDMIFGEMIRKNNL